MCLTYIRAKMLPLTLREHTRTLEPPLPLQLKPFISPRCSHYSTAAHPSPIDRERKCSKSYLEPEWGYFDMFFGC